MFALLVVLAITQQPAQATEQPRVSVRCQDPTNCTVPIQQAFDSPTAKSIVISSSTGQPVSVDPLFVRKGNRTIIFAPGLELVAKQGAFRGTNDCLLSLRGVSNVNVVATGATLRMRKLEYIPPLYALAEWRHLISIAGSTHVSVVGGSYQNAGGDGVYITGGHGTEYSRAILLEGITVDGAWRNGLSVISVVNLVVNNSVFANTNGTNPQCGIDLEPNLSSDRLQGIKFFNITLAQNARCGFTMGPYALANSSQPVGVAIDGMRVIGVPGSVRDAAVNRTLDDPAGQGIVLSDAYKVHGSVTIQNINISDTLAQAVLFANWPSGFIDTKFAHMIVRNCTHELQWHGFNLSQIVLLPTGSTGKDSNASLPAGGVQFESTTVFDTICRPWLSCLWDGTHGHSTPPSLSDISGSVTVHNPKALAGCPADFGKQPTEIEVYVTCNPQ